MDSSTLEVGLGSLAQPEPRRSPALYATRHSWGVQAFRTAMNCGGRSYSADTVTVVVTPTHLCCFEQATLEPVLPIDLCPALHDDGAFRHSQWVPVAATVKGEPGPRLEAFGVSLARVGALESPKPHTVAAISAAVSSSSDTLSPGVSPRTARAIAAATYPHVQLHVAAAPDVQHTSPTQVTVSASVRVLLKFMTVEVAAAFAVDLEARVETWRQQWRKECSVSEATELAAFANVGSDDGDPDVDGDEEEDEDEDDSEGGSSRRDRAMSSDDDTSFFSSSMTRPLLPHRDTCLDAIAAVSHSQLPAILPTPEELAVRQHRAATADYLASRCVANALHIRRAALEQVERGRALNGAVPPPLREVALEDIVARLREEFPRTPQSPLGPVDLTGPDSPSVVVAPLPTLPAASRPATDPARDAARTQESLILSRDRVSLASAEYTARPLHHDTSTAATASPRQHSPRLMRRSTTKAADQTSSGADAAILETSVRSAESRPSRPHSAYTTATATATATPSFVQSPIHRKQRAAATVEATFWATPNGQAILGRIATAVATKQPCEVRLVAADAATPEALAAGVPSPSTDLRPLRRALAPGGTVRGGEFRLHLEGLRSVTDACLEQTLAVFDGTSALRGVALLRCPGLSPGGVDALCSFARRHMSVVHLAVEPHPDASIDSAPRIERAVKRAQRHVAANIAASAVELVP